MRDPSMQKLIKRTEHRFIPNFIDGHGPVKVSFAMQTMKMWVLLTWLQAQRRGQQHKTRPQGYLGPVKFPTARPFWPARKCEPHAYAYHHPEADVVSQAQTWRDGNQARVRQIFRQHQSQGKEPDRDQEVWL